MNGNKYKYCVERYHTKMKEVVNLGIDEDPEEDWLQTFEISREIEQAFHTYEIADEISLFNNNDVLLQISESRLVVGNLLRLNLAGLKAIKAFGTITITFKMEKGQGETTKIAFLIVWLLQYLIVEILVSSLKQVVYK